MGSKIADGRGSALIGIEYSKRNSTLWRKHPAFRDVLESPYSSNGDYAFGWDSYYSSSTSATAGQFFPFLGVWAGNRPTTAAGLAIFPNRTCGTANCISSTTGPYGGGWYVNQDGSVYTSQNHGFAVDEASLPPTLRPTHVSLFDGTLQGVARTDRPAFSFQGHPEASPGPHDIGPLFDRFVALMKKA